MKLTHHPFRWQLEAAPGTIECQSSNRYFVGGIGDFTAILDRDRAVSLPLLQFVREPAEQPGRRDGYPQVMALEPGSGTDREAGERARLFVGGSSEYEVVFQQPAQVANPR